MWRFAERRSEQVGTCDEGIESEIEISSLYLRLSCSPGVIIMIVYLINPQTNVWSYVVPSLAAVFSNWVWVYVLFRMRKLEAYAK